jgi:hypothetical protein
MVLLYADVLGMKARWALGVDVIRAAYERLEQLVGEVFVETATGAGTEGGVQSDAIAITFPTTDAALCFARRLFLRAFLEGSVDERFWLRGLLLPCPVAGGRLATEVRIAAATEGKVVSRQFCDELLGAINIEQSFMGPRLLIAGSLITPELRNSVALPLGSLFIIPLRHLTHSRYPDPMWQDVLYLYPEQLEDASMDARGYEVRQRQRWASGSREEFEHVSHLALVWAECDAVYHGTALRAGTAGDP